MKRLRLAIAAVVVAATITLTPVAFASNPPNITPHQPPIPAYPCTPSITAHSALCGLHK